MRDAKQNSSSKKGNHLVCTLFGHDFDPIRACSNEDEYCHRCGKTCDEHDRWFEWRWWLKWKLLLLRRWVWKMNSPRDKYTF
ncbi:hypothetical protein CLV93_105163 [Prolixibacter denitrificans]|uniref:Uncharacterized protein n=1 Tax=Prolixibacter denitrificans TaxID=1541063 RepID=A0A2P8CCT1_9BACT|nr:hypothetical protein CLV93_105163 [Prolixibacter denitrificans]